MAEANSSLAEKQTSSVNSSSQYEDWLKTFNEMRLNEDETDVVLICGKTTFPAHKLILKASSPVFKTMFQGSFKESTLNTVEMNFEPSVVERVLNFIYMRYTTATTFESVEDAAKTLEAAHYLQIENLHGVCCHQLVKMASASDFSFIYSLNKYDKLMSEFIAKHGIALLKDDVHLEFNFNHFQMLLKELNSVVTSQDLIRETLKWIMHDDTDRRQYSVNLFTLIDISQLSRTCINSFIKEEVLQNDEKVMLMLLTQFRVAPENPKSMSETEESGPSKSLTKVESNLIKSLKLIQFIKEENRFSCAETSFDNNGSMPRTQVFPSLVEFVEPTPLVVFEKKVYLVCGSNKENESKICVQYSPSTKTAKCMLKIISQKPEKDKMDVLQIVKLDEYDRYSDNVYVMLKPDSEGKSSVYFSNTYEPSTHNYTFHTGNTPIWLNTCHYCGKGSCISFIYITRQSSINTVTRYCLSKQQINNVLKEELKLTSINYFPTQDEFKLNTTVCFYNCVYSFVGDNIYIYNISNNSCSCRKSGITVNDGDVVYPVRGYQGYYYYVVIRQDHSETKYSYSLLDVDKSSIVTELIATKGAVCETVVVV